MNDLANSPVFAPSPTALELHAAIGPPSRPCFTFAGPRPGGRRGKCRTCGRTWGRHVYTPAGIEEVARYAAGPTVGPGELMAALGLTRSSFMRAVARGHLALPRGTIPGAALSSIALPAPAGRTRGRWRQWTATQLPELCAALRALGREVPEGWEEEEEVSDEDAVSCGSCTELGRIRVTEEDGERRASDAFRKCLDCDGTGR